AIFLGYKRPYGIFLVALLFAAAELAAQSAQGIASEPLSVKMEVSSFHKHAILSQTLSCATLTLIR
ncbi:MAG: hypothetical protein R6U67_11835, partial [Sodalinema sp.]|uniref:hypothetical protein n=1 Tax=Sodalinema sp. TaxID=3080550 RepID=UPI00396F285D